MRIRRVNVQLLFHSIRHSLLLWLGIAAAPASLTAAHVDARAIRLQIR